MLNWYVHFHIRENKFCIQKRYENLIQKCKLCSASREPPGWELKLRQNNGNICVAIFRQTYQRAFTSSDRCHQTPEMLQNMREIFFHNYQMVLSKNKYGIFGKQLFSELIKIIRGDNAPILKFWIWIYIPKYHLAWFICIWRFEPSFEQLIVIFHP